MADQAPGGAGGWGAGQPGSQPQWGAGAVPPPPSQQPATWGAGYTPPPAVQPGTASPWHTLWKVLLIAVTLLYLFAIVVAFIGGTNLANQVGWDWAGANIGSGSVGMAFAIIVAAVFFVPWALLSLVLFLLMAATRAAPSAPVVFTGTTGGYPPAQGYGYAPPQGYAPAPPQGYAPAPPQAYVPPPPAAGPAKSCPRCGTVVPYDAPSCPNCGYSPGA